jgi:hypothetical protein
MIYESQKLLSFSPTRKDNYSFGKVFLIFIINLDGQTSKRTLSEAKTSHTSSWPIQCGVVGLNQSEEAGWWRLLSSLKEYKLSGSQTYTANTTPMTKI